MKLMYIPVSVVMLFGSCFVPMALAGSVSGLLPAHGCGVAAVRKLPCTVADSVGSEDSGPVAGSGAAADTVASRRGGKGTGFNALDYVMERRYLDRGSELSSPWYSRVFLEGGIGVEKMVPPTDDYGFGALASVHFGVGKRLDRLNTLRLMLHGDLGYQQGNNLMLAKGGGRFDYLFSLSSYFDGYAPTRPLDVSSVIGLGAQLSRQRYKPGWRKSLEGHFGIQFKFYTGPQAFITFEPYVGIGTDQMDVSETLNWRKYDFFYGAGISYVYYLGNTIPESLRRKLARELHGDGALQPDSTPSLWRKPWFMELSAGPHFMDASGDEGVSVGHETSVSVGKWLSPVLGLRLTASLRSARSSKSEVMSGTASYDELYHKFYGGARLDALVNPLGFSKRFSWDSRFGFYVLFGGELGRVLRYEPSERLNRFYGSWALGAHAWAQLSPGLQFFVEPRGAWYVYDIPYSDAERSMRCTDTGFSLNMGLTVTTANRLPKSRRVSGGLDSRFSVGAGMGTSLRYTRSALDGAGMGFNAQLWGEFRIDRLSAVRASFDYESVPTLHKTGFYDYAPADAAGNSSRTWRSGVWRRRYGMGIVSLDYSLDFTELMGGYRPGRVFSAVAYAGPSLFMLWGESASLHQSESLSEGHSIALAKPVDNKTVFGANVGVRLTAHVTPNWSVYLSPTLYVWRKFDLPGINFLGTKHLETLNLGLQYDF